MKTKVENIAKYGARHYFAAFSQEELEKGITVDEFIEDGWTMEEIEKAAERGLLEINGKLIKQIESEYFSVKFFTFKILDHEYGYDKIVHGLKRIHRKSGEAQYFIEDTEGFFEDVVARATKKGNIGGDVEVVGSKSVYNSDKVIVAFDMIPYKPLVTVYERIQHYGGAEEGGWYYHTKHARQVLAEGEKFETGLDRYGEGYEIEEEFIYGQHENTARQYYS